MTLPVERFNSIEYTREFLRSLLDPKLTPKVPRYIREQASAMLRHYPWHLHMEDVCKVAPHIFQKKYEK